MGESLETVQHTVRHGDCITGLKQLPQETVDLVFADPPFNIGYEYDVYNDRQTRAYYLAWTERWLREPATTLPRWCCGTWSNYAWRPERASPNPGNSACALFSTAASIWRRPKRWRT